MVTVVDSKTPIKSPFDILTSQEENGEGEIYNIPIRKIFEKVPKPTELEPVNNGGDSQSNLQKVKINKVIPKREIIIPREALNYIEKLILDKRPLKSLRFDLEEALTLEDVVKIISDSKLLSSVEKQDMLRLLGYKNINIDNENLEKELSLAREEYVSLFGHHTRKTLAHKKNFKELITEFGVDREMPKREEPKTLREARINYENYIKIKKENMGEGTLNFVLSEAEEVTKKINKIIMPGASPYIEKLNRVWSRSDNSSSIDFLLAGLDISKKSIDPNPVFAGFRAGEDEKLGKIEKKIENWLVEKTPVQNITKEAESTGPKEEAFPFEFKGKKLEVIKEGVDGSFTIRVIFEGKDIAIGELTKKGLNIELKPEYKAGWFFVKTPEEVAFKEKVMPFLKTLKV